MIIYHNINKNIYKYFMKLITTISKKSNFELIQYIGYFLLY